MAYKNRRKTNKVKGESIIAYTAPRSKISEQYRSLRTNLQLSSSINKSRTIVITSPRYGEGKSTITVNLAVSIAQKGEKVLIVDANLRKPTIQEMFGVENTVGLTDILNGKTNLEGAVKKTEMERLDILTSGPVPFNPSEVLGSGEMDMLIQKAMERYDIILFDSSPVLEVTDTSVLVDKCEGVLLVIRYNRTVSEDALETKRALSFTKSRILGAILNGKV
ncbi:MULTISPECIES: CpsD/CapB family tyrosine-protein kinase [Bacillus]|uniref:CpsD/CapB family tyrosine-protein kinase n=1 Tax=Bacillus TaxID=1386 RepID=UPI000BEFF7A5|nr:MULTISPECIES: CpsD/CapB family tyrosine-protein kinase [Bacillus]MBJ8067289.1 CpsD/CapB family tyrosine-protein kinase [Bacillus cereus group sp. N15]MCS3600095.1 capsular exopolysaccharide synthesis family protein [Bacillus sp. JUb91]PEI96538.1 tyrosine protein kinase [Bacillus toyonensis]PFZ68983.1 tyrosine protein kinase [Bacillus toyonensis]TBX39278.1 polysaccharide biosynthesis tyrosine autokinase [Bacillus toyonensis]